jgi:hypothetical protein
MDKSLLPELGMALRCDPNLDSVTTGELTTGSNQQ